MVAHPRRDPATRSRARGIGAIEVLTVAALAGFLILFVLISLPRGRETARMARCERNLMQLGMATLQYQQVQGHYPVPPPLDTPGAGRSPVGAMLDTFLVPDFLKFRDPAQAPKPSRAPMVDDRVAGLVCPSDYRAAAPSTAVSYRANAGDDVAGRTGPFAPGMVVGASAVEAADGLSFTAGYGERLIGSGVDDDPGPMNYVLVPRSVQVTGELSLAPAGRYRGDAGASWADPGWRSALYSHVIAPNAPTSEIAMDGRTAAMTTSSAHPGRINIWMLDGSLRGVAPSIAPPVWRAMGSVGTSPATDEAGR